MVKESTHGSSAVQDQESVLGDKNPIATVAVRDLATARRFYEEGLGLKAIDNEGEEAITYRAGSTTLLVYRSDYAGTNQATSVTWSLNGSMEQVVEALKSRGVAFEHYDNMGDMKRAGDVHIAGTMKVAWFKDPDGNIHALVNDQQKS
jgi:catechol 2,3-dioxygenase-like lactoylglutathione lyase family enzyme